MHAPLRRLQLAALPLLLGSMVLSTSACGVTLVEPPDDVGDTGGDSPSSGGGDNGSSDGAEGSSSDTESSTDTNADPNDPSGTYLLALEASLGPGTPLQWVMTVDALPEGADWLATIDLQPLSLDPGSTTTPREFNGPVETYTEVSVPADGPMIWAWGTIVVPGANNPITGSDMAMTLELAGEWIDPDTACGLVVGEISEPLQADLDGSTFSAIRLADDGSDPQTLPTEFPSACP